MTSVNSSAGKQKYGTYTETKISRNHLAVSNRENNKAICTTFERTGRNPAYNNPVDSWLPINKICCKEDQS